MNKENVLSMHSDSDTLEFLDDEHDTTNTKELVWRLMVVDDEPDVHRATTFALAGVKILGRPCSFCMLTPLPMR